MNALLAELRATPGLRPHADILVACADAPSLLQRHPQLPGGLPAADRERHAQFRAPEAGVLFAAARALLRSLLSLRLDAPPQAFDLTFGPWGKPELAGGPAFNVSHAGRTVVVAVGTRQPLGVDTEEARRSVDWPSIAPLVCSPAELAHVVATGGSDFLALWTRKEAIVKALGLGFSAPVPDIPGLPTGDGWSEVALPPAAGGAAVSVRPLALDGLHTHLACAGAPPHDLCVVRVG
jgi:4'-phosphopantetheinyl transferase